MVFKPFENKVLGDLCSKEQSDLLDSVDRLRSQGIDHYVSLPQIIVCGDQSSGKSSVLEAISGVSFPVNSNLCTRFPTELILRKTLNVEVSVSIVPDRSHNESERVSLSSFRETLDDFSKLPDLIDKAKTAMAIGSFGRAFSKDLLRIEVSGPDRPSLTIVDLPGLIHSETKQQSAADVELVQDVVKSYMKEPRSIILAVVSAKNDYANQIVLKLARAADKTGTRTLGVITKPDTLMRDSGSETMYVSLAQNLDVEFRLGWHVLKNMDSEAGSRSLEKRDEEERLFFCQGKWAGLPEHIRGIAMLRERLSKLLLSQIATELPSLVNEIEAKSADCQSQLQKLGQPRANIEEQRYYLLNLSQACRSLIKAAVDGTYNDPFFGEAMTEIGCLKRIRAVVQNLNQSFTETITLEGHCWLITDSSDSKPSDARYASVATITREQYLNRIEDLMKRTRGRELPGTFNPMIISDLFFEQSQPWEKLATKHIDRVVGAVSSFFKYLIFHLADASTYKPLFQTIVGPALEKIERDLKEKTEDLLASHHRGHPITYNEDFTEAVKQVKKKRTKEKFTQIIQDKIQIESLQPSNPHHRVLSDYRPLLEALMACNELEITRYPCSEALDCMQAYYNIALKRFVDDMAVEAIEKIVLAKLEDIISPIKVLTLAADVVTNVAGESEESRVKRKELVNQLDVLKKGLDICKDFMNKSLRGTQVVPTSHDASRASLPVTLPADKYTSSGSFADHEMTDKLEWLTIQGDGGLSTRSTSYDKMNTPLQAEDLDSEEPQLDKSSELFEIPSSKIGKKGKKKGKKSEMASEHRTSEAKDELYSNDIVASDS